MKKISINNEVRKLLVSNKYYLKFNRKRKIKYEENYHGIVKDPDGKKRQLINERKYKISQLKYILNYLNKRKPGKFSSYFIFLFLKNFK